MHERELAAQNHSGFCEVGVCSLLHQLLDVSNHFPGMRTSFANCAISYFSDSGGFFLIVAGTQIQGNCFHQGLTGVERETVWKRTHRSQSFVALAT